MLPPDIVVLLTVTFPEPTAAINAKLGASVPTGWKRKTSGAAGNVPVVRVTVKKPSAFVS